MVPVMSNPPDPFEFVKNLWGQMGIPGFGPGAALAPGMPSFAPEELEKRLGELKQIRQWLEINLNMLSLQVNGLEMQLSALKSFKSSPGAAFVAQASEAMRNAGAAPSGFAQQAPAPQAFGQPGFGQFPFGMPGQAPPASAAPPPPPPAPLASAAPAATAATAATTDAGNNLNWPDPTGWMQALQAEFVKGMAAVAPATAAPSKVAARKAPVPARKAAAKKARGKA